MLTIRRPIAPLLGFASAAAWPPKMSLLFISQGPVRQGTKPDATFPPWVALEDERGATKFAQKLTPKERLVLLDVLRRLDVPPSPAPQQQQPTDPAPPVSRSALYHLAFYQSLPFVGFGFLDNLIMIVAGEYIDHHIGLTLGISTMAAAALGNTISDVFGVGSAWYVEHWSVKLGVNAPTLTMEQLERPACRLSANLGRAGGVVIGCLLGMAPLLF